MLFRSNNPFNIGLKWNLSSSHPRHDICDSYVGKVFQPEDAPLQHPNCLCYFTEENVPIEDAIKELKAWSNGKANNRLDKWLEEYEEEFI